MPGLNDLPLDVLFEIYSYLSLADLANVSTVTKRTKAFAGTNANKLWSGKFAQYFPEEYKKLKDKNISNWYVEFRKEYTKHYIYRTNVECRLINLLIENDTERLKQFEFPNNKSLNFLADVDEFAPIIANCKPEVLKQLFSMILRRYTNGSSIDAKKKINGLTILFWALYLRQDADTISHLLKLNNNVTDGFEDAKPLLLAVKSGNLEVVKLIVQVDAALNDNSPETPLHTAVENNYPYIVEYLLSKDVNPNIGSEKNGKTPLDLAIQLGRNEIAKRLISMPDMELFSIDSTNQPIHIEASAGNLTIVKELLEKHHFLINTKGKNGNTPLIYAFYSKNIELINFLLKEGADINEKTDDGLTVLGHAMMCQLTPVVEELVAKGAMTSDNFLLIHYAAAINDKATVERLLKQDPKLLNVTDQFNQTALIWAASNGHQSIVNLLIKNKAKLENTTEDPNLIEIGKTALYWATANNHSECVKLLLEAGANVEARASKLGLTPFLEAAKNGNIEIIKLFYSHNPDIIKQTDWSGKTPLMYAAENGHANVVDFLTAKKSDLNTIATIHYLSENALSLAIKNNHLACVISLLDAGTSADQTPALGNYQYIHYAVELGNCAIVEALLNKYPDQVNLRTSESDQCETPLSLATKKGNVEMLSFLLTKGADCTPDPTLIKNAINSGSLGCVKALIEKDKGFLNLKLTNDMSPVYYAESIGLNKIVSYLRDLSELKETGELRKLLENYIREQNEFFTSPHRFSPTIFGLASPISHNPSLLKLNQGIPMDEKLIAAIVLLQIIDGRIDKVELNRYQNAFQDPILGSIYDRYLSILNTPSTRPSK